ncbi:MAG: response regulator [Euryarchaeota archaeon]|nr:response regulator [Euryarchaeota archaeon]
MTSILVIDDSKDILSIVKRMLKKRGYDVVTAVSAEEALRKLRKGYTPNVIFLDILMPGMSGEELLSSIKNQDGLKNIPVYILSVVTERDRIQKWLGQGAKGFIPKPFSIESLEAAIRESQNGQ